MQNENVIRILIADDHPIVCEGLAAIIDRREDMSVVGQAYDGKAALELFREQRPDITLMDLRMPNMDGVTTITQLRTEFPDARIIVLTTFDSEEDIYRGLQAGAKAFLLKDSPRDELLEAIRAVYSGQRRIPENVAVKLAQRISQPFLTPREVDVLRLMVGGNSNMEIAHALCIAEGTVKAHVNSILEKMSVNDRTQAVTSAIRRGLVHLD